MSETKYGKHLIKATVAPNERSDIPVLDFSQEGRGLNISWRLVPVTKPKLMVDTAHYHDFDQFICFVGSDPNNIGDFDAEIELLLGEEGEKHVITAPTIAHIPPGLVHCPLEYKRVDKPVLHLDIFLADKYVRKTLP